MEGRNADCFPPPTRFLSIEDGAANYLYVFRKTFDGLWLFAHPHRTAFAAEMLASPLWETLSMRPSVHVGADVPDTAARRSRGPTLRGRVDT